MSAELRSWCDENNFDFSKFTSKGLTLDKLATTRGVEVSVLAEELGLKNSADRGRFIDAVRQLKDTPDDDDGDDPEVVVKGGDEDEKDNQSVQDESFKLRSNFSDDPEDQWDIVAFFDQNAKFQKFRPILMLQMQIQNNTVNGDEQHEYLNHEEDHQHLLDLMLPNNGGHDSSSDSDEDDDDVYHSLQHDTRSFREYIANGYMPSIPSLIYDNVLAEYGFGANNSSGKIDAAASTAPFFADIEYAVSRSVGGEREHFMSIALGHNIARTQAEYRRRSLNCVVILDTSAAMNESYNNLSDTKQAMANRMVSALLTNLDAQRGDRFCLLTCHSSCAVQRALQEVPGADNEEDDVQSWTKKIMSIESEDGGAASFEFDEGYNAALGQLQELFDVQIMAAANGGADDDEKKNETPTTATTENRIIVVSASLPNADSSLFDLVQVYSDSDENPIFTSFVHVGDAVVPPSSKLNATVNKIKGCNLRSYASFDSAETATRTIDTDFDAIVNPIFFNVALTLRDCAIDTVYGYHSNLRKITKLNRHGTVDTRKTVFLDDTWLQQQQPVIVVRLQSPPDEDDASNRSSNNIPIGYTLSYEQRDGKTSEVEREIALSSGDSDDVDSVDYYESARIRKRILLIRYVEYLSEWRARDKHDDDNHLHVSPDSKARLQLLLDFFTAEAQHIEDDTLQQEIQVLKELIEFDAEKAQQLRQNAAI